MTLEEVKQTIDARLAELSGYIEMKQSECIEVFGRYFQALPTHTALPVGGEITPADNLGAQPTDQPFGWNDVGGYPLTEPIASTCINTYCAPAGMGFVVELSFIYDGVVWLKAVNFGPEQERGHDWLES